MPPATFPNAFAVPEITEGSLRSKSPETGNISPELDELILVGKISNAALARCAVDVDVVLLDILEDSADEDTEGLISAAIENKEVA